MAGQNNVPPDWAGWKRQLLAKLQAPDTPANEAFLNAWARREGGGGQNNPFNTTYPLPGATNLAGNAPGVKNYPTPDGGVLGTYLTLQSSYYRDILADLRAGTASTTKSYAGLGKWSGGGYTSLSGTPTTPPAGSSRSGVVGDVTADQGFGPQYGTKATGDQYECIYSTHVKIPLAVTTLDQKICWDKTISVLLIGAGGVLMLGGLAVLTVATIEHTPAGRAATKTLAVAAPVARLAKAAAPAQRQARAQTRQAQADRRTAPTRQAETQRAAEARREAAEARRRTDARRRARHTNAAEKRRQEAHELRQSTRLRSAASRPGRSYDGPNAGRSTASIAAANRERNRRRELATTDRPPF